MFKIRTRYIFILLLSLYSFLNIKFSEGDSLLPFPINDLAFIGIILVLIFMIWEGNRLLQKTINPGKKISQSLLLHFGMSILLVGLLSALSSFVVSLSFDGFASFLGFKQTLAFVFRINLFLHCINAIMTYSSELSASKLEAEQIKSEHIEAKYDSLRKQINPHFLFNSFNILSAIIENDPTLAVKYVDQLTKMYRYILKVENLKQTTLSEEIAFIKSYIFLLKMRFTDNLIFNLKVDDESGHIPPITLQLLVENAIKHNEVSRSFPLHLDIYRENDTLIIANNKNPKENKLESSNVGLSNIQNRYQLLARTSIEIVDTEDNFSVSVPVLASGLY